jgi:hypothetical protein
MKIKEMLLKAILCFSLLVFVLMLSFSCGKTQKWEAEIRKENGVIIVENPAVPKYKKSVFDLKKELSIGENEGPEEHLLADPRGMAVDDKGRIYVLDFKLAQIKVFDRDGTFLKTIGGKGQGPGEMSSPISIHLTGGKNLLVSDPIKRELNYFSLDGAFIRKAAFKTKGMFKILDIDSQNNMYAVIADISSMKAKLNKYNRDFEFLQTLETCPIPYPEYNPLAPDFSVGIRSDDSLVSGLPVDYEIKVYSAEGKLIRIIRKPFNPVRITEEEKNAIRKRESREVTIPEYHTPFSRISVDSEDRIFVRTYTKTETGDKIFHDVFDAEGRYIARVPLKASIFFCLWRKDKLYTLETDKEGYIYVQRYQVKWDFRQSL